MARRTSPITVGLAATLLAATLFVGGRSIGTAPPLGPLLDPLHGMWALARNATPPVTGSAPIAELGADVDVRFDDRGVPHIFATSVADAVRALGYVHARDRLFQMELQTRAVAGTVSELVGDRALPVDRDARGQGLAASAKKGFDALGEQALARTLANAYSEGVNAWLAQMGPDDLPFEFRLLGATPQPWLPMYGAYLFARMGLNLAYSDGELRRAATEALVGHGATDALFPRENPIQEPIQPNGQRGPRLDWRRIPAPEPATGIAGASRARVALAIRDSWASLAGAEPDDQLDDVSVGSNNWVVGPRRTAAGRALLAGDPHLGLTLPAIWYEAHLVVPDTLDVYGVTLVGAPLPAIGFNRDVAWSVTNTGADVADYFLETVDDDAQPAKYQVDGQWRPLTQRVEVIRGKRGNVIKTDTIHETHRGPMLRAGDRWVSRRWTVTDGIESTTPFYGAARSRTVRELWTATDSFHVPAQNFVAADRAGHIALRSTGHFPLRGRGAAGADRGDVLLDGAKSTSDWTGWWPRARYPQVYDPPQGFAVSANQQPKDPRVDPGYLGFDWPSPWRAMRINEMLRADSAVTPDAMRRMQTDPVSAQTKYFLPAIIEAALAGGGRDTVLARVSSLLKAWDGQFTSDNTQAVLYEATLSELASRTWDELNVPTAAGERQRRTATPENVILVQLMQEADSPWWDVRSTPDVRERRDDIIRASVAAAWHRVHDRLGEPGPKWEWGKSRFATVRHLTGFPALSRLNVPVRAGPGTVTPSSGDGNHSASWRMVVELGPEVRAWGIYPGGQSGNPISPRYAEHLGKWSAGTLDSLRFPRRADDLAPGTTSSRLTLRKEP